jgi:hypothetical protein
LNRRNFEHRNFEGRNYDRRNNESRNFAPDPFIYSGDFLYLGFLCISPSYCGDPFCMNAFMS